jgi:hypothetical protein
MKMRYTITQVTGNRGEAIAKAATYADAVAIANTLLPRIAIGKVYIYERDNPEPCYTAGTSNA